MSKNPAQGTLTKRFLLEWEDHFALWKSHPIRAFIFDLAIVLWLYFLFLKIPKLESEIREKDKRISELQTEIAPFNAIAIEKFSSSDPKAMRQLADDLLTVDSKLQEAQEEIKKVAAQAAFPMLRKIADIYPMGIEITVQGGSRWTTSSQPSSNESVIYQPLSRAIKFVNDGKPDAAESELAGITRQLPDWPYAYYYLGCVTGKVQFYQQATECFERMRSARIQEPELSFVEALCLTFLSRFDDARTRLNEIETQKKRIGVVPVISYSPRTPEDIVKSIQDVERIIEKRAKSPNPLLDSSMSPLAD